MVSIIMTGSVVPANALPMTDLRLGVEQIAMIAPDSEQFVVGGAMTDGAKEIGGRVVIEIVTFVVVYVIKNCFSRWLPIPASLAVNT